MKLNVKAFGLAMGILWGGSLVVMGILAMVIPDYCADFVAAVGSKYIGYTVTIPGLLLGGLWGFVDAGIGGLILAWLYNKFAR